MMKKLMATLCALLLVCVSVTAFADTLVKPNTPETLKALIGGKSFNASITGLETIGQDEDSRFTISITVCERDHFDAALIDNLQVHDIIRFGDGTATMVMEVSCDEFGVTVKDGSENIYIFNKAEDGSYIVTTDTDYPIWTEVFTVKVPLEKDIAFLDWGDPENLEGPVKLGFEELLDLLYAETSLAPYNTKVTFDENGKLVEFLYTYSPFN